MEALANLGIDGKLFLAQAVNFLILLFVLRRFAYKPMLEFLEKRTERIEQGLQDAEAAKVKLSEVEKESKEALDAARAEARSLVAAAEESAKKRDQERLAETEARVKKLLSDAETKISEDRAKMLDQAKGELAETVVLAIEKILGEKIDAAKEKELIAKNLE